jgi:hypothetical protein
MLVDFGKILISPPLPGDRPIVDWNDCPRHEVGGIGREQHGEPFQVVLSANRKINPNYLLSFGSCGRFARTFVKALQLNID